MSDESKLLKELFKAILRQLHLIHSENIAIYAKLTGYDTNNEYIKKMNKMFEETWGELKDE